MSHVLPSIRRELLARLLTTALVPLLLVGGASMFLWGHYLRSNAYEDLEHLASNRSAELRGRLLASEAALQAVSEMLAALEQGALPQETVDGVLAAAVDRSPLFETVYRIGSDGTLAGIGLPGSLQYRYEDYRGIDLSRLPILDRVRGAGRPLWSDSHLSLITGQPCLTLCMPFRDGQLVASTRLSTVENLPFRQADSADYGTVLLDAKGVILLGPDGRRPAGITKLDHLRLVSETLAGRPGNGPFVWAGQDCLATSIVVPETGWVIVSFARQNVVLGALYWMMGLSALGIALGTALAAVLAVVVSRRIARPLARLSGKTALIAQGRYAVELDAQPYRELEQVAESLRHMGLAIQDREQRQRTVEAELRQAQKMEAMGRLVGGIAHDFNNMLQGIRGFTELAQQELPRAHPTQELLQESRNACMRAAELVQQLLVFSRKDNPRPDHLDLNAVVSGALRMLRRVIGERISLEFTPCDRPAWVHVDKSQIEQVIMNLSVNARDAMPDGGRLSFATRLLQADPPDVPGERIELVVADTGRGMTPEILSHIFDPFFTTKEVGKGTGLGLSTVYGILRQAGGSIVVESEPGRGSTFRLHFPHLAPSDAPQAAAAPEAQAKDAPQAETAAGAGTAAADEEEGDITVLIAEDDAVVRSILSGVLRAEGYRVLAAADGVQAAELFGQHADSVTAAVLDIIMPRKNGREVADLLWARRPRLPVLFTSGYFTVDLDPSSLPPGQSRLLRKPYGKEELIAALRDLLRGRRAADG